VVHVKSVKEVVRSRKNKKLELKKKKKKGRRKGDTLIERSVCRLPRR
jgi:hypothetical protein